MQVAVKREKASSPDGTVKKRKVSSPGGARKEPGGGGVGVRKETTGGGGGGAVRKEPGSGGVGVRKETGSGGVGVRKETGSGGGGVTKETAGAGGGGGAVRKGRSSLNVPLPVMIVDLSDVQLCGVDEDDYCVECQRPMNTSEHYKSVRLSLPSLMLFYASLSLL